MEDGTIKRRNKLLTAITITLGERTEEDIRNWLTSKITNQPKTITLEYIAAILNIDQKKEDTHFSFVLD